MRVLYACSFPVSSRSGHGRATAHKLAALRGLAEDLEVMAPAEAGSMAGKVLGAVGVELRAAWRLLRPGRRPEVFISRGHVGPLSLAAARLRGVLTVREVHTRAAEEAALVARGRATYLLLRAGGGLSDLLDRVADLRIFNNPRLLDWYRARGLGGEWDVVVYNGADWAAASRSERDVARRRLGLPDDVHILAFVGAAARWHGVHHLARLQAEFDRRGDPVVIVVGGGAVGDGADPEGRLRNLTPLDDAGCAELIRAADACLLPVHDIRISPGSPLKLYDYIANERFVFAQASIPGYSDEVLRHGVGAVVDFADAAGTRQAIVDWLNRPAPLRDAYRAADLEPVVSWRGRIREWMGAIEGARRAGGARQAGEPVRGARGGADEGP